MKSEQSGTKTVLGSTEKPRPWPAGVKHRPSDLFDPAMAGSAPIWVQKGKEPADE